MVFVDGQDSFETTDNLEQQLLKFLRKKQIQAPFIENTLVTETEIEEFEFNLSSGNPFY